MPDFITPAERLQHVTASIIAIAGIQRSDPDSIFEDPKFRDKYDYKQATLEYNQINRVLTELLRLQSIIAYDVEHRHDVDQLPN